MFGHKITQEEYDKLGYQQGQIEERNRQWISQADGMPLAERQIFCIIEREGFW